MTFQIKTGWDINIYFKLHSYIVNLRGGTGPKHREFRKENLQTLQVGDGQR